MNPFLFIVLLVACVAGVAYLKLRTSFPYLCGPGLRDYLPNGDALSMFVDSRLIVRNLLKLWKKHGDVFQLWLGPKDTLVTAVPGDILQVLSKTDVFVRPQAMRAMLETVVPGSVFTLPTEEHLTARNELRENFNYKCLRGFHGAMIEAVEELCQDLTSHAVKGSSSQSQDVVNINEPLSIATVRVITNVAFGFKLSREERLLFAEYANDVIAEMMLDFVGYPIRQALTPFGVRKNLFKSKAKVDQFCQKFIQKRLEETKDQKESRPADLLDAIVDLKNHDMTEIRSQTLAFAVAGAHTLHESISWCIYETCCSPHTTSRIRQELGALFCDRGIDDPITHDDVGKLAFLRQVWKEVLRLHPPGAFVMRTAAKEVTLRGSGIRLPKGGNVLIFLMGAQMNPHIWREPNSFLPERWAREDTEADRPTPGSYLPFSIGPKNCAGQFLAEYEALVILASLYRRFEFSLACDPDQVKSCSGWVEGARSCVDGSDFGFGVPVHVKLVENLIS